MPGVNPLHPRERLARDTLRLTGINPLHPKIRLEKREKMKKIKNENNESSIEITGINPVHPRERFAREKLTILDVKPLVKYRKSRKEIDSVDQIDIETLTKKPYIDVNVILNSPEQKLNEYSIIDQLVQNLLSNNDKFYTEHGKELTHLQ